MKQDAAEPERHRRSLVQNNPEESAPDDAAVLDQDPQHIAHADVEHVHGPEEVSYGTEELIVLCVVRDGRPYVRSFIEHYSSMGVKHLVFLDNGSTDGTMEALKEYDNVTVLRTGLPFKSYKVLMRRYLIERFGRGRWSLYADIDELFDYPYSDIVGLGTLLGFLNSKSYTAVVAQMLDVFPEEPLSSSGQAGNLDEPLKERHRFYDISTLERTSIKERIRSSTNTTYESDEIEVFFGGVRGAVFGTRTLLTKHPLVFLDGKVKPMNLGGGRKNLHWHSNARVADFTCVLFHYKFLDEHFHKQATQAVREEQYARNSLAYKRYLEVLERTPSLLVKGETAREIKRVDDLVENGFLVVSEDYMMLVYDKERKGAGRAARREEPGIPEEEAFYKARAKAKVQSLRAWRFKRQVEELREENRRLIEEHQERVEKLKSRLAREQEKNKDLAPSTQAFERFGLLSRLGRAWDRVTGRKR